jgi:hypothetical protein
MTRVAKTNLPHDEIRRWFDVALRPTDPRPRASVLDQLARELQIYLNRTNDAESKRAGMLPLPQQKDISPAEFRNEIRERIQQAAGIILPLLEDLEKYPGSHALHYPGGDILLKDLREILRKATFVADSRKSSMKRGQPPLLWKDVGIWFAKSVSSVLREAGYKGRLGIADPKSAPVNIAAAAMRWAYGRRLSPSGFAAAMRQRDQRKKASASVLNRVPKDNRSSR